jgi:hypothetical protein
MAKKTFEMEWPDEELHCVFNAVVVMNSPIAQRYPGGLSAFVEVCPYTYCNEKILTYSSMGGEVNEVIDELVACGFKHKVDFLFIEASLYLMAGSPGPFPVDLKVDWLKGRFEDGGVYVRFVESMPGFPLKPRKLGAIPETVARSLEPPIGDDVPLPTIQLKGRTSF